MPNQAAGPLVASRSSCRPDTARPHRTRLPCTYRERGDPGVDKAGGTVVITAIDGIAGTGRTARAVRWEHRYGQAPARAAP